MMKTISCISCWKEPLSKDEIGICMKLLGKKNKKYYCLSCLASSLDTTTSELEERIREFKEEGCRLFI